MKKIITFILAINVLCVKAQTILFVDGFESYTAFSNSGLISAGYTVKPTGFQVYNSAHAYNSNRAITTQIFSSRQNDTIFSPAAPTIHTNSRLSFYFRVCNTGGTYPLVYNLSASEKIDILASYGGFTTVLATITSANQNTGNAFRFFSMPVGAYATLTGAKLGFAPHGVSTSDFFFDVDSLLLIDTVAGTTPLSVSGVKTNVSCNGGNNGAINITATGGTSSYTYNWGNGVTTEDRSNLTAGTYNVTVSDGSTTATASFTITQPTALTSSTSSTPSTGSNGTATVTAGGGTTPYTYLWTTTPAKTTASINGLAPGKYYVQVRDSNGCLKYDSVVVANNSTALSVAGVKTDVSCSGGSNGGINITASGGTGNYTYNWGGGVTTEDRSGLAFGTYTVTVSDGSATATASFSITQPSPLGSSTSSTPSSGNNGTATVVPTGGTTPYQFTWSTTPAQTTATATGLAPGKYFVQVADSNGCLKYDSAVVALQTGINAVVESNIIIYPNPAQQMLFINGHTGLCNYSIVDMLGRVWHNNVSVNLPASVSVEELPQGSYLLMIRNSDQTIRLPFIKELR
ncbi:MAG: T9SS type A sorting domain-containing protein [Chitinophagales bacterium]